MANISKEDWLKKNINDCILDLEDPECNFYPGSDTVRAIVCLTISLSPYQYIMHFQPFFCGSGNDCSTARSQTALKRAMANIEAWYPVMGVLEDLESTLFALEFAVPRFFKGVTDIYYLDLNGFCNLYTLD